MDFAYYPMDQHLCPVKIGSTNSDDRYEVFNSSLAVNKNLKKLQYDIEVLGLTSAEQVTDLFQGVVFTILLN